tara:strand:+ start:50 stop:589 length:540 start_codon:yes stop_codon:yes gene_type:complete
MRLTLRSQLSIAMVFLLLIPVASAHGANSFSFIMRNGSLQPESAEVVQNDTLIFYNVVDYERSLELDKDEDGVIDYQCTATGFNSTTTDDECRLWLDPNNWTAGEYALDIISNGSLWKTLSFTLIEDVHNESGPPTGYSFGEVDGAQNLDDNGAVLSNEFLLLGVLATLGVGIVARRGK